MKYRDESETKRKTNKHEEEEKKQLECFRIKGRMEDVRMKSGINKKVTHTPSKRAMMGNTCAHMYSRIFDENFTESFFLFGS